MIWKDIRIRGMMVAAGLASLGVAPSVAQKPALAMLDQVEPGRWEIRERTDGTPVERICLRDGRRFIQLRHSQPNCERLVISDSPMSVTVQYTCRGRGYGLTHIRKETSRLLQIQSQGIADGLPFEFSAEARRVGDCAN